MRLDTEFIKLPLAFDAARLAAEVAQFAEEEWQPHPQGHAGNAALPLLAVEGDPRDNATKGVMRPTPQLERCPYLRQVLAALAAPIGRTRLMRIDGNAEATLHVDVNYYWQQRLRVHVPIVTDPAVQFLCGERSLHMAPGEAWVFDTWRPHNVINPKPTRRIHLVVDTAGSGELSALLGKPSAPVRQVPFDPGANLTVWHEVDNFPVVMPAVEQRSLYAAIQAAMPATDTARALDAEVQSFMMDWKDLWDAHGVAPSGWRAYDDLLESMRQKVDRFRDTVTLANDVDAAFAVQQILIAPALNTDLARRSEPVARRSRGRFDRPVFIVSSPRSGSTLLFETLAQAPGVCSIGGESHMLIEGIDALHPAAHGWESNRLTEGDATDAVAADLAARFASAARDRDGRLATRGRFRFLEKTPKNSLRIPFLRKVFPDAFFIYLFRDERATMSSMLEAWRSGRFVTYDLPGWNGQPWSLALVPGWRELAGRPLAEIAVRQWKAVTDALLADLEELPPDSWCVTSYDRFVSEPQQEIQRLCDFVGFEWDRELALPLPTARHTLTPPAPDKWKANAAALEPFLAIAAETSERARNVFARQPLRRKPTPVPAKPSDPMDFRSVHTTSIPTILTNAAASLMVSTYQSGRLVTMRADGPQLNTHLSYFPSPMGLAFDGQRLAIGTLNAVWDYRNMSHIAAKLHPAKHDACFIPRNMHVTGDIRVHELAFDADGELWIVNTRFSALCTLDHHHSFLPRWRPPFVTALAAEDRCHLNGLGMFEGRPKLVTALGRTDTVEGWRENKAAGGIVMDVPSGEIVAQGLSMPHSPRWHNGRWWVLESAKGTLGTLDLATGKVETVAEMPGFTRGLAMIGDLAFVGLSQVRESVFEGIPLGKRLRPEDRSCGVWVIDLTSGATVGFVKFSGTVQEIFDVQLLPGLRFPELLEPDAELIGGVFELSSEAIDELPK